VDTISVPLLLCAWERKRGLRGALSANKRLSQGTASMLNARYKNVSVSLLNRQKTHSVSIIKTNYINVSAQSGRISLRKMPVYLRAKCPYISAQSVRMSPRSVLIPPAVSVCLRAKCPYVSAQCPYVSAQSVLCLRAKMPACLCAK
jgi:hypothetical protein